MKIIKDIFFNTEPVPDSTHNVYTLCVTSLCTAHSNGTAETNSVYSSVHV